MIIINRNTLTPIVLVRDSSLTLRVTQSKTPLVIQSVSDESLRSNNYQEIAAVAPFLRKDGVVLCNSAKKERVRDSSLTLRMTGALNEDPTRTNTINQRK